MSARRKAHTAAPAAGSLTPGPDISRLCEMLEEIQRTLDHSHGLYVLKYELLSQRDNTDEGLPWFSAFHEGCLDGAMDGTADSANAKIGMVIEMLKEWESAGSCAWSSTTPTR